MSVTLHAILICDFISALINFTENFLRHLRKSHKKWIRVIVRWAHYLEVDLEQRSSPLRYDFFIIIFSEFT